MNGVFGVGPFEMLLIAVLALIFIGPEKLPGVIGQLMRTMRELRTYAAGMQNELRDEFQGLQEEVQGVTREVEQWAEQVSQDTNAIASEVQQVSDQMAQAAEPVNELMAPPPARDGTSPLPAPAGVHTNGASHDADEDLPAFADYRPS